MKVSVRSSEPRDVDAVLGLMRQLAEHEGHGHFFELTSETLRQACFAQPRRMELIVAETEGEIVGYARACFSSHRGWVVTTCFSMISMSVTKHGAWASGHAS